MSIEHKGGKGLCGAAKDDFVQYKREHRTDFYENATAADDGSKTLYLKPVYTCLYNTEDQKVSLARVQDNHHAVNLIFSKQNTSEINELPEDDLNPWAPLAGDLNVQLLPLDKSKVTVNYVKINTNSLSNTQPVSDAASRVGVQKGLLNVYIGSTTSAILGQAERPGIISYVDYRTVGGFSVSAIYSNYNKGKTLAHEILHNLDLTHTFSDLECDNERIVRDIPEQIRPNFNARVVRKNNKWSQENDNRDKDRAVPQAGRSCLTVSSAPETNTNEMAVNLMDYGNDNVSRMISKDQVIIARNRLLVGNNDLTLFDADGVAQNDVGGLTNTQIIFVVIGAVLLLLFLITMVYYARKEKKTGFKLAASYTPAAQVIHWPYGLNQ